MKIDDEKFCSDIIIGGYIAQILRVPLYDERGNKTPDTDYILWDIRTPAGKNLFGTVESIFFVQIRGSAIPVAKNIFSQDYVKIKGKVIAQGIMGAEKRFLAPFYRLWIGERLKIIVDNPEQILVHEVMEVGKENENY